MKQMTITFSPVHRPHRRRGFTLLEALLAGVGRSVEGLRAARDYQRAASLLDEVMTKIDVFGPDRLMMEGPLAGTFSHADARFEWEATIESLLLPDLYDVRVRVVWSDGPVRRHVEARTRLTDPANSRLAALAWEDL